MQLVQTAFSIEQASQGDQTINIGAFRYLVRLAVVQQETMSSLLSSAHSWTGKYFYASFTRFIRLIAQDLKILIPTKGVQQSTKKRPLSGMAQTLDVLVFSMRQLEQKKVPMPPEDTPVNTIDCPLQKSNFYYKNLNCYKTFAYPLKQSFLSLYEIGSYLYPVYSLPSQQMKQIFVQSQNTGLSSFKVDSSPQ